MDMQILNDRASAIIDALAGAILSTAEAAADRIQLAADVARVQNRMAAMASVLEALAAQKLALEQKHATATGPMRALIARQIELLTAQELAVLERVGVPAEQARPALESADQRLYRRNGSRFVVANGE